MRRWLAAAVCVMAVSACSQDGSTPESATPSRGPSTAGSTPSPSPGSEPATESAAPSPTEVPAGPVRHDQRCFGARPTIRGTASDDRIHATGAEDVIVTYGGNDVVSGLDSFDKVCTGPGKDRVFGVLGDFFDVRVDLGSGDDQVLRGGGTIRAGAGDDTILIARGNEFSVAPGTGDDLVRAASTARRAGAEGTACVRFRAATGPVHVNLTRGRATGQGRDRLVNIGCVVGGRFNDVLIGTDRGNWIEGGGGLNLVRAGAGDDYVTGGERADEVYAGAGDDTVIAGGGWDRLYGGPGGDLLAGSSAIGGDVPGPLRAGDYLDGGAGDDYLFGGSICEYDVGPNGVSEQDAPNELFGRAGNDGLTGEGGNDRLDGGSGVDSGQGGWRDGRIDWITSVEIYDECASPYRYH
jgi:Ca2+-binding RTX toxin-like protein